MNVRTKDYRGFSAAMILLSRCRGSCFGRSWILRVPQQ
jgi:hypothetical protein